MTRIDELIMIIPVILNLKGNLEMNLSARLGTSANMGDLDIPAKRRSIILGNLTLLQVQATVVSFFAACVAFLMSTIVPDENVSSPNARQCLLTSRAALSGQIWQVACIAWQRLISTGAAYARWLASWSRAAANW